MDFDDVFKGLGNKSILRANARKTEKFGAYIFTESKLIYQLLFSILIFGLLLGFQLPLSAVAL